LKGEAIMPIIVRRATPADIPTIVDFNRRMALETEDKNLDLEVLTAGVKAAFADPNKGPYYLAEAYGEILGQAQITFEWTDWRDGWFWWFRGVYIRPDARRRGVFRAIYEHVYDLARKDGRVIGLRLYVEHNNKAAQETYRRMGMESANYFLFQKIPL